METEKAKRIVSAESLAALAKGREKGLARIAAQREELRMKKSSPFTSILTEANQQLQQRVEEQKHQLASYGSQGPMDSVVDAGLERLPLKGSKGPTFSLSGKQQPSAPVRSANVGGQSSADPHRTRDPAPTVQREDYDRSALDGRPRNEGRGVYDSRGRSAGNRYESRALERPAPYSKRPRYEEDEYSDDYSGSDYSDEDYYDSKPRVRAKSMGAPYREREQPLPYRSRYEQREDIVDALMTAFDRRESIREKRSERRTRPLYGDPVMPSSAPVFQRTFNNTSVPLSSITDQLPAVLKTGPNNFHDYLQKQAVMHQTASTLLNAFPKPPSTRAPFRFPK